MRKVFRKVRGKIPKLQRGPERQVLRRVQKVRKNRGVGNKLDLRSLRQGSKKFEK